MGLTLNLMAKQYKPLPDDRDTYTWVANGGNVGALSCPPFAISDIDDAQRTINRYVEDNTIRYIQEHVSSNLILWESFSMALRMSNSKGVRTAYFYFMLLLTKSFIVLATAECLETLGRQSDHRNSMVNRRDRNVRYDTYHG